MGNMMSDWSRGRILLLLFIVTGLLVAYHYNATAELLSGLMGSVIGALATVYSTEAIMKSSADQTENATKARKEDEFKSSLRALKAEVQYNALIAADLNNYYLEFSNTAWEHFWCYQHRLDPQTSKLLLDGYMNVSCFGKAREVMMARATAANRTLEYIAKVKSAFDKVLQSNKLNA